MYAYGDYERVRQKNEGVFIVNVYQSLQLLELFKEVQEANETYEVDRMLELVPQVRAFAEEFPDDECVVDMVEFMEETLQDVEEYDSINLYMTWDD